MKKNILIFFQEKPLKMLCLGFSSGLPILLIAYFQWGTSSEFWYIIIIHILIQVIDGNVVVPVLFSDAVNLHPLAILISILFFGTIWGIWGVFFAIPLAVLMNTLLNIWPRTEHKV